MKKQFNPIITIVTPSLNQGQFIEETILSVLNQSYQNIQYIIVDGGSTDNTMEVVEKYRDRIDIIIHEKDKGQSDAINKGFKLAKGDLVGWINSDDYLYPNCIEKIVDLYELKNDGAIYFGSSLHFIDIQSKVFKLNVIEIPNRNHLLNNNYSINQPGSFYSSEMVKKCNYLNEKLNYCMDLDLWLNLLMLGPIYSYHLQPIAAFRMAGETKTLIGGNKFLHEIRRTLLFHEANFFSKNIIKTLWYELKVYVKKILTLNL